MLDGQAEHSREVLGNKGHGIDVMRRHALPVPPAFCITTEVGVRYLADPDPTMDAIWDVVIERMGWLEAETSRTFGRGPRPLLVSVRSGATQSMPGMMDTILDLGVNDAVEQALARACTAEFARDTRRRFNRMYRRVTGQHPAEDPYEQLRVGIGAVFTSWNSPRAKAYREHYGRDDQGVPRWSCRRWCSATRRPAPAPVCSPPVTRSPAQTNRSATGCPAVRATTWSRDWWTSSRSPRCATSYPPSMTSLSRPPAAWSN
ncbi:hypothetical protein NIIDMKKI_14180 [Mycobacterium kansasii]|uniref:Pyruvate phosphate dikinase AMP/ATP-binding domain-containing protein n=1 Tax=Mycobacterium kansasii TaxID=1768 RepID=A0A7G1I8S9_MYCKA|nr:hypothetical protein NIIDMKKI_14180 [Mycobacterium kansasii]